MTLCCLDFNWILTPYAMSDQKSSTKAKPRFFDGVWVGKITEVGYIVFDPTIHNLYDDDDEIALWVEKRSSWQYYNEDEVRSQLRENLGCVTNSERARVARKYWCWRCDGHGYSQGDYLKLKQNEADETLAEEFLAPRDLDAGFVFFSSATSDNCDVCKGRGYIVAVDSDGCEEQETCRTCGGTGSKSLTRKHVNPVIDEYEKEISDELEDLFESFQSELEMANTMTQTQVKEVNSYLENMADGDLPKLAESESSNNPDWKFSDLNNEYWKYGK